tara:strand:- start:1320 stop:1544 length:225 start_codon:yes stop_codon:yes gene_type:complete
VTERTFFAVDYPFFFNLVFIATTAVFVVWAAKAKGFAFKLSSAWGERILFTFAMLSFVQVGTGLALPYQITTLL